MVDAVQKKPRELLPDVEAHLDKIDEHMRDLSGLLSNFEVAWANPSGDKLAPDNPSKEEPTAVDRLYQKMQANEERIINSVKRLQEIKGNYVGDR